MSDVQLLRTHVKHQILDYVRLPVAVFFTLVLPLLMLVLFSAIFGDQDIETPEGTWPVSQFYVAGLATFTAVSATFTNLVNTVAFRRQLGTMKRWYTSPAPRWMYPAGFIGAGMVVAFASVVLMLLVGVIFYGTEIDPARVPALLLAMVTGILCWSAIGMAVAGVVRNPEAAPAVANALVLPLAFVSDVFIPMGDPPAVLDFLGKAFPLGPFADAMKAALEPFSEPPAFRWGDLAILVAWGIVGVIVARKTFTWLPTDDHQPSRRRRRRK